MMEAVRSLGLASRFVSGYVYVPSLDLPSIVAAALRMPGAKSISREPAGWISTRQTASSAIAT